MERARSFMEETGQPFEIALTVTRAGNLFTTHTAVAAGFDRFAPRLSVLDGWWAEAFSPEVGWALGMARSTAAIRPGSASGR